MLCRSDLADIFSSEMSMRRSYSKSIFTWKGAVFSTTCEASKLKVNWYWPRLKLNDKCHHRKYSDEDHEDVETSDQEIHLDSDDDIFMNNNLLFQHEHLRTKDKDNSNNTETKLHTNDTEFKSSERKYWSNSANGLTEIDVFPHENGNGTNITVITTGFSFDPGCCVRVPVFLVLRQDKSSQIDTSSTISSETKNKEKRLSTKSDLILFGLSEIYKPSHTYSLLYKLKHDDETGRSHDESSQNKSFKLIPLRTFSLRDELIINTLSSQNIAFISDYGFLHVDAASSRLQLYFGSLQNTGETTQVEHFLCVNNDMLSKRTILLFEIYNFFEINSFLLISLLGNVDDDESQSKSCVSLYLFQERPLSKKFEMKATSINSFFPQEFSKIMLSFSILYSMPLKGSCEKFFSSVIIISTTGFAIKFVDGQMTHYIRLVGLCDTKSTVFQSVIVNIIDFIYESNDHAAICIDNSCEIVNWSKKEVISSHSNVSFMSKYDILCTGCPTVLLLLNLNLKPGHTLHSDLCVKDLTPMIIDGTESERSSESDGSDDSERKSPKTSKAEDRHESGEGNQEQSNNVTKNVLDCLIQQERKCRSDFKEMEQGVKNKEFFIENMLQMFSNNLSLQPKCDISNLHLQPLVPLFGEPNEEKNSQIFPNRIIKVEQLWKRTVDSLLICGLEVTNISRTHDISDMNLALMPINPPTSSIHCKTRISSPIGSSSGHSDSPVRKKIRLESGGREMEWTERSLKFGKSNTLTSYTDTNQILGGETVRFKVLLRYKSFGALGSHSVKQVAETQNVCCGEFSVSVNDVISESFALKPRLLGTNGDDLNNEDVLALDSIQKGYDLEIKSVMTSVLSLNSSLKQCPSVGYISWADQYIITADLSLRYCRIKWLNQPSRYEARLRVYTRSQKDVISLVQFLYNLTSKDITIMLPSNSCQPSVSAVKSICQSLIDRVDNSITQIKGNISLVEQTGTITAKEDKPKETEMSASSSIHKEEKTTFVNSDSFVNKNNNSVIDIKDDDDEVLEILPKSPTFQSPAQRRGKPLLKSKTIFSSASKTPLTEDDASDKRNMRSFKNKPSTLDTSLFMPDVVGSSSRSKDHTTKDSVTVRPGSKGKSGKGGTSKGKGKLMMKRS